MVEPNGRPCNLQGRANGAVVMVIVDTDVGELAFSIKRQPISCFFSFNGLRGMTPAAGTRLSFSFAIIIVRPDSFGRRPCLAPPSEHIKKNIRSHIQRLSRKLSSHLKRLHQQELFERISQRARSNDGAKLCLLARRCRVAGPPLHIALGWAGLPSNQAAINALFCGDTLFS